MRSQQGGVYWIGVGFREWISQIGYSGVIPPFAGRCCKISSMHPKRWWRPNEHVWSERVGEPPCCRTKTPKGCGPVAHVSPPTTGATSRGSRGLPRCTHSRLSRSSASIRRRSRPAGPSPLVAENGRWEHEGQRYFDGEVEPCINGRTIETGAYFGVDVDGSSNGSSSERLDDGGWNCEAENGSVRSSFDTTINVLDGLLEYERVNGGSAVVREARQSGEEYLLERNLYRRKNTGEVVDAGISGLCVPVLLALRPAASARLLPPLGCYAGSTDGRGCRSGQVEAAAGRSVASRPDPSWSGLLRHRGPRWEPEPLEHAAGAPRARLVGRRRLTRTGHP